MLTDNFSQMMQQKGARLRKVNYNYAVRYGIDVEYPDTRDMVRAKMFYHGAGKVTIEDKGSWLRIVGTYIYEKNADKAVEDIENYLNL